MKKLILLPFLLLSIIGWSQTAEDYFDMAMKKSEAGNTQAAILDYDKAIDLRPAKTSVVLSVEPSFTTRIRSV